MACAPAPSARRAATTIGRKACLEAGVRAVLALDDLPIGWEWGGFGVANEALKGLGWIGGV